jgi:hypothetical protein
MRVWLAGVLLLGGPLFLMSLLDVTTGSNYITGEPWVGVIVPAAMVVFGFFLPKFGRLISVKEERFLLEYLENNLAAKTVIEQ